LVFPLPRYWHFCEFVLNSLSHVSPFSTLIGEGLPLRIRFWAASLNSLIIKSQGSATDGKVSVPPRQLFRTNSGRPEPQCGLLDFIHAKLSLCRLPCQDGRNNPQMTAHNSPPQGCVNPQVLLAIEQSAVRELDVASLILASVFETCLFSPNCRPSCNPLA
jgi:hypothetical protein